MTDYIYPNITQEERVRMLKKMCRTKEQRTYTKSLSDTEVAGEEKKHASDTMRIHQLKDDLKEHNARVKGQIKELETTQIERLEEIANRRRQVYDWVYGLPDQINGKMMFYDGAGELIDSRDLYESEKQKVLFVGEDGQTASEDAEQPKTSESVLNQFRDVEDAQIVEESADEYEPSVNEEAPNEEDLESEDSVQSPTSGRAEFLDSIEGESNDEPHNLDLTQGGPNDPEDWRQKPIEGKKEKGTAKRPRKPKD